MHKERPDNREPRARFFGAARRAAFQDVIRIKQERGYFERYRCEISGLPFIGKCELHHSTMSFVEIVENFILDTGFTPYNCPTQRPADGGPRAVEFVSPVVQETFMFYHREHFDFEVVNPLVHHRIHDGYEPQRVCQALMRWCAL